MAAPVFVSVAAAYYGGHLGVVRFICYERKQYLKTDGKKNLSEMVDLALVLRAPSHFMHQMCRFYFRAIFLSEEDGQFQSMLKLHLHNSWMLTSAWADLNALCMFIIQEAV